MIFVPLSIIAKNHETIILVLSYLALWGLLSFFNLLIQQLIVKASLEQWKIIFNTAFIPELIMTTIAFKSGVIHIFVEIFFGIILSHLLLILGMSFAICAYELNTTNIRFSYCKYFIIQCIIRLFFFILTNAFVVFIIYNEKKNRIDFKNKTDELWRSSFSSTFFSFTFLMGSIVCIVYFIYNKINKKDHAKKDIDNIQLNTNFIFIMIGLMSLFISVISDNLISSIFDFSKHWDISSSFLTINVIPILFLNCWIQNFLLFQEDNGNK